MLLTFDMVQACGWNFYDYTYSYMLQISKYIPIHIFVCKKAGAMELVAVTYFWDDTLSLDEPIHSLYA